MTACQVAMDDPLIEPAIAELTELILSTYPDARFEVLAR